MGRSARCLPALLCALPWPCHSCSLAVLTGWCHSLPCCSDGKRDSGSVAPGAHVACQKLLHQANFSDHRAAALIWGAEPPGAGHGQPPGSPGLPCVTTTIPKAQLAPVDGTPPVLPYPLVSLQPQDSHRTLGTLLLKKGHPAIHGVCVTSWAALL